MALLAIISLLVITLMLVVLLFLGNCKHSLSFLFSDIVSGSCSFVFSDRASPIDRHIRSDSGSCCCCGRGLESGCGQWNGRRRNGCGSKCGGSWNGRCLRGSDNGGGGSGCRCSDGGSGSLSLRAARFGPGYSVSLCSGRLVSYSLSGGNGVGRCGSGSGGNANVCLIR